MTTTLRRVGRNTDDWPGVMWRVLGVALALLALGMFGAVTLPGPAQVERVTVVNSAEFDVQLFIASTEDSSLWLRLPTAPHDGERIVEGVIDPGESWNVHARAQGRDGGMWQVSRESLEADGWRLEVPDEVIAQLRSAGAPATPP